MMLRAHALLLLLTACTVDPSLDLAASSGSAVDWRDPAIGHFIDPTRGETDWRRYGCTATLVTPSIVLTAGHCVGDRPWYRTTFEVRDEDGRMHATRTVTNWVTVNDAGGQLDDLALGYLDTAISTIAPMPVAGASPEPGTAAALRGFGSNGPGTVFLGATYVKRRQDFTWQAPPAPTDATPGYLDSGAPAVVGGEVVGVMSLALGDGGDWNTAVVTGSRWASPIVACNELLRAAAARWVGAERVCAPALEVGFVDDGVRAGDVRRELIDAYAALGGADVVGPPISPAGPFGVGYIQNFDLPRSLDESTLVETPSHGVRWLHGGFKARWAAQGNIGGPCGYPTTDEYTRTDGVVEQDFDGGAMTWRWPTLTCACGGQAC